jgi:hypothetical protein
MHFLSSLGNIFHAIGSHVSSLVDNIDGEDERKKRQQQQASQPAPIRLPASSPAQNNPTVADPNNLDTMLHLQPLQKANPAPVSAPLATRPIQAPQPAQPAPQQLQKAPTKRVIDIPVPDQNKILPGVEAGAAKFLTSSVDGAIQLPALLSKGVNWLSGHRLPGLANAGQKISSAVAKPVDKVLNPINNTVDQVTKAIGPQAQTASNMTELGLNAGTTAEGALGLAKGGAKVLRKVGAIGRPGEVAAEAPHPDAVNGLHSTNPARPVPAQALVKAPAVSSKDQAMLDEMTRRNQEDMAAAAVDHQARIESHKSAQGDQMDAASQAQQVHDEASLALRRQAMGQELSPEDLDMIQQSRAIQAADEHRPVTKSIVRNAKKTGRQDALAKVNQRAAEVADLEHRLNSTPEAAPAVAPVPRQPIIDSPLDVPAFQRQSADQLVKLAQDRVAQAHELAPAKYDQATRQANAAELAAAMARSPQEGAQVLRKQLLQKAAAENVQSAPEGAQAGIEAARAQAAAELEHAQQIQAARDLVNPPAEITPTQVSQPPTSQPLSTTSQVPLSPDLQTARTTPTESLSQPASPVVPTVVRDEPSLPGNVSQTEHTVNPQIAAQMGGTAKTGEVGASQGKFARGQEYEKTSQEAANQRGANEAANTSYDQFKQKLADQGAMTTADRDTARALMSRFDRTSLEFQDLSKLIGSYHTETAQVLATIEKEARKTADPKALTDYFAQKLYATADNVHVSDSDFAALESKNQAFADARDSYNQAIEDFNNNPSQANVSNFVDSMKRMEDADRQARFEEYQLADRLTKGNKDPKVQQFIDGLKGKSGVYTMDYVDTSLLSSTRVMLNNFLNTIGVRAEEKMFGKVGAALARQLTGVKIGGGAGKGAKLGAKLGSDRLKADAKLRQAASGNLLVKSMKNAVTSGNTLGERNIFASAYSGILDHYKVQLKAAGYTGDELNRRALVNSLTDPDNVADSYMNQSLADNAMASVSGHNRTKIETEIATYIGQKLGGTRLSNGVGKAIMRVTVGYPTVIGRSLVGGAKRTLLGTPDAAMAVRNAMKGGDPEKTALLIKNSVKQAGSGATLVALGTALGGLGLISGPYPANQDERDQWARESKTENSINILGHWYSLPSALGVFALPFMLGANAGTNLRDGNGPTDHIAGSTLNTFISGMPIDSLNNSLAFVQNLKNNDSKAVEKYLAATGSSLVKMAEPVGSFVGEVAKMFDPNANDNTTAMVWRSSFIRS